MTEIKHANPGVKMADICRMAGQMWRVLPDEQKQVYRDRFHEEQTVVKSTLEGLSVEEKEKIKKEQSQRKLRRMVSKKRKLLTLLDKPKAVDVNPFNLFVKSRNIERGDAPLVQYIRGMAEHWKKMPEDDKKPFVEEARVNSARHRARLLEWERRMLAEGHPDVIRRSVLAKATKQLRVQSTKVAGGKKHHTKDKKTPPATDTNSPAPPAPDNTVTKPKTKTTETPAAAAAKPKASKKKSEE